MIRKEARTAGLRIHEVAALTWRDVDLVRGRITVGRPKTDTGIRIARHHARTRVVNPAVARADELLAERGHDPLPNGVTAHKLRHTFTSILFALGKDPAYVMGQLGHRCRLHVARPRPPT